MTKQAQLSCFCNHRLSLQLVTLHEAKLLLKEDDEVISKVHGYWRGKRLRCKVDSLIPTVRQDRREGTATVNPYIAFRRRTEKMQTRKVCSGPIIERLPRSSGISLVMNLCAVRLG